LIYGLYGKLVGIGIARELEGTWVVMVLPFLDTGYLEVPGFSSALNAGWLKLIPGYFPARITIEAGFATHFDVGPSFLGGSTYALVLWLLTAGSFWYVTHSYLRSRAEWRATMRKFALLAGVAVAAIAALLYLASPDLAPAGVQADGQVSAPKATVVSLVNGEVRSLDAAEGQVVTQGQELGVVQDFQTGDTERLVAPRSGVVGKLDVRAGENVVAGDPVAEVYDLDRTHVELDVAEGSIDQIRLGEGVEVYASGLPQPLHGRVSKIGMLPIANPVNLAALTSTDANQVKKYPVDVTLDGAPEQPRTGVQ
jgi:biotin carboxyl carrier protein